MLPVVSLFYILLCALSAQNTMLSSYFFFTHDKMYKTYNSLSFLMNASVNSINKCAAQCSRYSSCQTVSFYSVINICFLHNEQSSMGQMINYTKAFILTFISNGKSLDWIQLKISLPMNVFWRNNVRQLRSFYWCSI